MSAVISTCGRYRYSLTRHIPSLLRWVRRVTFVMLNPSTADASSDDPTIRRCIDFAERHGGTELQVVNLFALRATDPAELTSAMNAGLDAVGPENDYYLGGISALSTVIVAWGAHSAAKERAARVLAGPLAGRELFCLGTNADGSPKHPLYLPKSAALIPWGPAVAGAADDQRELEEQIARYCLATGCPMAEARAAVEALRPKVAAGQTFRATMEDLMQRTMRGEA